jgi:hypothetical protein
MMQRTKYLLKRLPKRYLAHHYGSKPQTIYLILLKLQTFLLCELCIVLLSIVCAKQSDIACFTTECRWLWYTISYAFLLFYNNLPHRWIYVNSDKFLLPTDQTSVEWCQMLIHKREFQFMFNKSQLGPVPQCYLITEWYV